MNSVYTQEFDIEKFIRMIKDHSFIYNPRDPKHCNRFIISASWKNIALEMNSTDPRCDSSRHDRAGALEFWSATQSYNRKQTARCDVDSKFLFSEKICRNKWTTLRSNYVRELRKHNDPTSPPKTKWPYFDVLNFLQPYIKSRVPVENLSGTEAEDENSLDETTIKQEDFIEEKNWLDTTSNSEPKNKIRSYPNDFDNQIPNEQKKMKECYTSDEDDDDKHFLLSILPQIRQLSPKDNLLFRLEVQQLLIKKLFP